MKLRKKIKATRLARKMHPDVPVKGGHMLIEVDVNLDKYRTTERLQMANQFMQFGLITTPEQYLNIALGKKEFADD